MRIVTLEEHFSLLDVGGRSAPPPPAVADAENMPAIIRGVGDKITDLGEGRVAEMDRHGITVMVLSKAGIHMGPSADMFEGDRGGLVRARLQRRMRASDRQVSRPVRGIRPSCREHARSGRGRTGAHRHATWLQRCADQRHGPRPFSRRCQVRAAVGAPKNSTCRSTSSRPAACRSPQGLLRGLVSAEDRHGTRNLRLGLALRDRAARHSACVSGTLDNIRGSISSSAIWARRCRSCWRAATRILDRPVVSVPPLSKIITDQVT